MRAPLRTYFQIFKYTLQKRKTLEYLNLQFEKTSDKWTSKRKNEYLELAMGVEDALAKIFPGKKINDEVFNNLEKHIDHFIETKQGQKQHIIENPYPVSFGLPRHLCRLLYALCFHSNANIVIETGVANGFSSSYILLALESTKKGKLHSIDQLVFPWHTKEKIGSAIPDWLKKNWTLIIGDSTKELPRILNDIKSLNVFYSDSLNRYKNFMREFEIIWPYLNKNGIIYANDVSHNDAFLDFCDKVNCQPIIVQKGNGSHMGIIQK